MPTKIINVLKDDSFEDILDIFNEASANEVIFVLPKKHLALAEESHFVELAQAAEETGKSVLILASSPTVNSLALKYKLGILTNEKNNKPSKVVKATKAVAVVKEDDEVEDLEPEPETVPVESADEVAIEEEVLDDEENDSDDEKETKNEDEEGSEEMDADEADKNQEYIPLTEEDDDGTSTAFDTEETNFPEVQLTAVKRQSKLNSMSDIIHPPSEEEGVKVNISAKPDRPRPLDIEVKKQKKTAVVDNIEDVWQSKTARPDNIVRPMSRPSPMRAGQLPKIFSLRPNLSFFNLQRKTITFLGAGVVVIFIIAIYISTGSASIIIKPRSQDLNFSIKVTASDQFSKVDADLKKIPGQLFSVSKKAEDSFPATGQRDVAQKAKGKITVYNEYGTTTQALIATTRFESSNGLIFHTLKTIIVPGTTVKNGVITPGKIDVEVIADKAGDTYNIAAGKFTVPAFKEKGDTDRYNKFYGTSTESMKGGIVGKAKVVTNQDYISAKDTVSKKLLSDMETELRSQASGLKILTLPAPDIKDSSSTAQPDEATDTFVISETAELKVVAFKESDLYDLIGMYISNLNNLMILPEKLSLEFKDVKFNKDSGSLEFNVAVRGLAYGKIDKEKIISDLIGKNEEEIKTYIKGVEDSISSAKVVLSPFWVRRVPTNKEKIKFEIQY